MNDNEIKLQAKNHKFVAVQIMESNRLPTTRPRREQRLATWTWQLPISDIDDRLVLRRVDITQAGKLTADSWRHLKTLAQTGNYSHQKLSSVRLD